MLNKMLLIGNVGRDPEMRYTPSGSAMTTFSVAVNRRYTPPNGEPQEETEWFRIVAWNRLAETCNTYVTRGMKVYVEGRLKSDSWVGQDGQTRFTNDIIASTVTFLNRPQGGGGYGAPPPGGEPGGYGGGAGAGGGYGGGGGYGADGEYGGPQGEPSDADDLPW